MTSSQIVRCSFCTHFGLHGAFGWCSACYQRWKRAGRPEDGPPQPLSRLECAAHARAAYQAVVQGRREDYVDLLSWGETREQAAARLGVCEETTRRYDRALRKQVPADA
ncbi:hypothetical protein [Nonomuraea guangzhouensis]|uniref:Sigma-70 family RNA polymerase sigma factor n=1 Tax=Nonomuraea guangzhouensis TaxID=1291555 RepID=A0ABW4GVQ4_9ACTN|nr:hypothetical protein [Nonomuraea guangzhouensis]